MSTLFYVITIASSIFTLTKSECNEALIDGPTYNVNFTASSTHSDGDHPPSDARLGSDDAWCSMTLVNTDSPWVQVEFDFPVEIHSVAVAGHDRFFPISNEYIVNYYIQFRPVGGVLQFVMDSTQLPQVFPKDEDHNPETVSLSSPILNTEVLRIVALPGSWNTDRVCVRFEAYGCPATIVSTSSSVIIATDSSQVLSSSKDFLSLTQFSNSIIITASIPSIGTHDNSVQSTSSLHNSITTTSTLAHTSSISSFDVLSSSVSSNGALSSSESSVDVLSTTTLLSTSSKPSVSTAATSQQTQPVIIGSISGGIGLLVIIILFVMLCVFVLVAQNWNRKQNEHHIENTIYGYELNNAMDSDSNSTYNQLDHTHNNEKAIPPYAIKSGEENIYEEMDKQYAYVTQPTSFPVVDVPLKPPSSEIKENLNPEQMSPDPNPAYQSSGGDMMKNSSSMTFINPMYGKSSGGDKTEDSSSITKENDDELVNNPMYGESSGDRTEDSSSITKENDDELINNPMYGESSGGDKTEDSSSITKENDDELVNNPMYGESSGGDKTEDSSSITKENDDELVNNPMYGKSTI